MVESSISRNAQMLGDSALEFSVEAELYELTYYATEPTDTDLVDFLVQLIEDNAPGRRVLDCACGTGEPGLHLADRFSVSLSDASEAGLRIARQKANQAGLDVPEFRVAEWADLSSTFPTRFDAVLCTGNALAQCTTREARRDALAGMAAVLRKKGMLYIDFRADRAAGGSLAPELVEVIGPLDWKGEQLVALVYERFSGCLLERIKDYYRAHPGAASHLTSVISRYLPFTSTDIAEDIASVGLTRITFHDRPGRWPLVAVTAIRS
jgi:ubiquinone/menaquinone biosynthesis C-methylase UbiE